MKRGFSLAELLVAMGVTIIVSVVAYSTCSFAISQTANDKIKSFFIGQTENYAKCYFLGETNYANGIKLLTDIDTTFGQDLTVFYANDLTICEQNRSEYFVEMKFVDQTFEIKCIKNADQKSIFEMVV